MRLRWLLRAGLSWLALYCALAITEQARAITFSNVASNVGLADDFANPSDPSDAARWSAGTSINLPQIELRLSGGASVGDFDGDGWDDLYFTRHFSSDLLFRNFGNGVGPCGYQFCDVTAGAFAGGLPSRKTNGSMWGDIDNDYDLDLYVTSVSEDQHYLYINNGSGQFTEQAVARGAALHMDDEGRATSGSSVSMGDYDNDGYLDLLVGEWRVANSVPSQTRLFRNLGADNPGHFEDVTAAAGVAMDITNPANPRFQKSYAFTPRFGDFDRDGLQDIGVASDFDTSRLFWNNGDGTFSDGTLAAGIYTGDNDMGFDVADVNRDGYLDWFITDIENTDLFGDGNGLFLNNGNRTFTDAAGTAGVRTGGGFGWGTKFFDYDNDGDLDLTMTNGELVDAPPDFSVLWRNGGNGAFTDVSIFEGVADSERGRGLVTFDHDNDGDMDVLIVNIHDAPVLYENAGNGNHWLRVETIGTASNTLGAGAVITVTPDLDQPGLFQTWEVSASSNYLGGSEKTAHFGLGSQSGPLDLVTIRWPTSGLLQQFTNVAIDGLLTAVEPLPGDFDLNGTVDLQDYIVLRDLLGTGVTPGTSADHNGSGWIDEGDYLIWMENFGSTMPAGAASGFAFGGTTVPEPSTQWLSLLLLTAFVSRLRLRR